MATDALVGTTFDGRYEIARKLASGGFATVYEARHVALGKRVAIKVIDGRCSGSREVVARFQREARVASTIESDHVVQVFDVGEVAGVGLYMVMEYLHGEDLAACLAREQRLSTELASAMALQTAWALAKAHEAGVVHRDLKPANLFLVKGRAVGPYVKLLDFGIAKLTEELEPGSSRVTGRGLTVGTPLYMSPEQVQGHLNVDCRTDIWSLGAVLFEALAGRSPFAGTAGDVATMFRICQRRASPLAEVAPWVPEPLAALVDAALEPDRSARIADAVTFAERLVDAVPGASALAMIRPSLRPGVAVGTPRLSRPTPRPKLPGFAPGSDPRVRIVPAPQEDAHIVTFDEDDPAVTFDAAEGARWPEAASKALLPAEVEALGQSVRLRGIAGPRPPGPRTLSPVPRASSRSSLAPTMVNPAGGRGSRPAYGPALIMAFTVATAGGAALGKAFVRDSVVPRAQAGRLAAEVASPARQVDAEGPRDGGSPPGLTPR